MTVAEKRAVKITELTEQLDRVNDKVEKLEYTLKNSERDVQFYQTRWIDAKRDLDALKTKHDKCKASDESIKVHRFEIPGVGFGYFGGFGPL